MSVLILILASVLYAVVHSWLATLGVKKKARKFFGPNTDRWYRLAYNIFAGISFLPILFLLAVLPDQRVYLVRTPWVVLFGLGQLVGVVVIILGIWQTDAWHFIGIKQIFNGQEHPQNQELNIRGLYGWVRHPLYTGGLIFIWFSPVMTVNLLALFTILTLYLVIGAKLEEKRLIHEYGPAYREYQLRVPMLLPKLWFNRGQTN